MNHDNNKYAPLKALSVAASTLPDPYGDIGLMRRGLPSPANGGPAARYVMVGMAARDPEKALACLIVGILLSSRLTPDGKPTGMAADPVAGAVMQQLLAADDWDGRVDVNNLSEYQLHEIRVRASALAAILEKVLEASSEMLSQAVTLGLEAIGEAIPGADPVQKIAAIARMTLVGG